MKRCQASLLKLATGNRKLGNGKRTSSSAENREMGTSSAVREHHHPLTGAYALISAHEIVAYIKLNSELIQIVIYGT